MKKFLMLMFLTGIAQAQMSNAYMQVASHGGEAGGGGDVYEMKVDEIRSNILDLINEDDINRLQLPTGFTKDEYRNRMMALLQPKFVRLIFVSNSVDANPELTVDIDGSPKTCRSFFSKSEHKPTILCLISRFKDSSEIEKYRLIHHEYASLALIERNDGVDSDYKVSQQFDLKDGQLVVCGNCGDLIFATEQHEANSAKYQYSIKKELINGKIVKVIEIESYLNEKFLLASNTFSNDKIYKLKNKIAESVCKNFNNMTFYKSKESETGPYEVQSFAVNTEGLEYGVFAIDPRDIVSSGHRYAAQELDVWIAGGLWFKVIFFDKIICI